MCGPCAKSFEAKSESHVRLVSVERNSFQAEEAFKHRCQHCKIPSGGTKAYVYCKFTPQHPREEYYFPINLLDIKGAACYCCYSAVISGGELRDPATCACMQHAGARERANPKITGFNLYGLF